MPKIEAEVEELKQTIAKLCSFHKAEVEGLRPSHQTEAERLRGLYSMKIERKDTFFKAEKVRVLVQMQTSYTTKLLGLYDEHSS